MKNIKLISVLATALLLSACQTSGVSVSKPKFAKEGDEIKLDAMKEEFVKDGDYGPAIKNSEFFKEKPEIGSKEIKSVESRKIVSTTVNADKKETAKSETKSVVKTTEQGDSSSKVIK